MAELSTKFRFVSDDKQVADALKKANAGVKEVNTSLKQLTATGAQATAQMVDLGEVNRRQFDLSSRLAQAALRDSKAQIAAIEEEERAYRELTEAARAAAEADAKRKQGAGSRSGSSGGATFNDNNFGQLGQLAGALGNQSGQQLGTAISDILGGVDAFKQLADAGRSAFESIKAGQGIIGGLATGLQTVFPALSATAAGIGAITIAGGLFVAAAAGVVAVINQINMAAEASRLEAEKTATLNLERFRAVASAEQLIQKQDFTGLRQRVEESAAAAELAGRTFQLAGEEWLRLVETGAGEDAIRAQLNSVAELTTEWEKAQATADEFAAAVAGLTDEQRAAYNATSQAAQAAIKATEDSAKAEADLAAQREQAAQQLAALEQQERDLLAAFADTQRIRQEDLALSREREQAAGRLRLARADEDLKALLEQQQLAHAARMTNIQESGNAALEQLQASISDKQIEAARAIVDVQASLAKESAAAAIRYQREELQRLARFNLDKLQRERDYRAREQALVDDNDLRGLLALRTERRNASKEAIENFNLESDERSQNFEAERAQREQAAAERIAQIQAEAEAFRVATQARIQQEAASIQERLRLEQKAFEEQQKRDADARALRQARDIEDALIRREIQRQDQEIYERRAQENLNKQLARLDAEQLKAAQLAGLVTAARTQELDLLSLIILKGQQLLQSVKTTTPPPNSNTPSSIPPPTDKLPLPFLGAFADGGKIPKGRRGLAYFEGYENEYVFNERQMRAGMGGMGGASIRVEVGAPVMNFPDGVTVQQAEQIAAAAARRIGNELGAMLPRAMRRMQKVNG